MTARAAAVLGLSAILSACEVVVPGGTGEPADTQPGEVEIELAGAQENVMLVPVHLNGEGPYDFVFDTGATLTCVGRELAERLDLPAQEGAGAVGVGVGGSGDVGLVTVDSVRVGTSTASDMTACVLELEHLRIPGVSVDGLLGLNFLRAYKVEIDFERGIVRLE